MTPKRPVRGGWEKRVPCQVSPTAFAEVWERHGLRVLSSFGANIEAPDSSGDGLATWLVSVSREGTSMPTDRDMKRVRRDFDMKEADEDNHESGIARKLFLVVDPSRRVECECKTDETVIVREDGYRYSVPVTQGVGGPVVGRLVNPRLKDRALVADVELQKEAFE